jgi:hypothetical protein
MKKIIFLLSLSIAICSMGAFAQSQVSNRPALDKSNPNYEHDRITYLWLDSQNEPVSTQAIEILRNRAIALKMPEAKVMRNQFIFRILENKKLSLEDRIWAADFFIRASANDISYPLDYIKTIRSNLSIK